MQSAPLSRAFALLAVVVLASAVTVAGCSLRQKNEVINASPDGITIEHDTRYPTMAGVDADEHCAKFGKLAKRVETNKANAMERVSHPHAAQAVFACVSPGQGS